MTFGTLFLTWDSYCKHDGLIDNDEKVASSKKHTRFKTRVQNVWKTIAFGTVYTYITQESTPPPPGRNSYFVLLLGIHNSKFKQTTPATGTSASPNNSCIIFKQSKSSKPLRKSSSQWPFFILKTHYTSGRTWASIYSTSGYVSLVQIRAQTYYSSRRTISSSASP